MSGRRTTLLGVVFLALLAAWIAAAPRSATTESESPEHLLDCQPAEVTALRLEIEERSLLARRRGGEWEAPAVPEAELHWVRIALDAVASAVCGSEILDRIENPGNLGEFGLDPAAATLTVTTPRGDRVVAVGGPSPAHSRIYSRIDGRGPVLGVGAWFAAEIEKLRRHASP